MINISKKNIIFYIIIKNCFEIIFFICSSKYIYYIWFFISTLFSFSHFKKIT